MVRTVARNARLRAALVVIAPAIVLAGFAYHPYITPPTDPAAIAAAAAANPARWGLSHLAIAIGYGLIILAFVAVRSYLREMGEERWSVFAIPFVVLGSTLFVVLTGMEFTLLAAVKTGTDARAAQTALMPWFVPILLIGGVSFALGVLSFALGIAHSGVLSPRLTRLVVGALVVMAGARFVPLAAGPLVLAAAGILAFWLLASQMWKHPEIPAAHP